MRMSNLNMKIVQNDFGQHFVLTQVFNSGPTYDALAQRPLATVGWYTDSRHSRGIDPKPGLSGSGYVDLALGPHTGQSDTGMGLCAGLRARSATRNT